MFGKHVIAVVIMIAWSVIHRSMIYLASAYPYTSDSLAHYNWTSGIIASGDIFSSQIYHTKYFYAPFTHISGSIGSTVTGLTVDSGGMFISISLPATIISSLILYSFVKRYWQPELAVLSTGVFLTSDYAISGAISNGSTQMAAIYFICFLYITHRLSRAQSPRIYITYILVTVAITLTHQATSFVALFFGSGILLTTALFIRKSQAISRNFFAISIFLVVLLFDWMISRFGGPEGDMSPLEYAVTFLPSFFSRGDNGRPQYIIPPEINATTNDIFTSLSIIHVVGGGFLFGVAIIGAIYWIDSHQKRSIQAVPFSIGCTVAIFLGLVATGPLIGQSLLRPGRWFMHIYFIFALLMPPSFLLVFELKTNRLNTKSVIGVIIAFITLYAFIMGGGAVGAVDDPVFDSAPGAERLAISDIEQSSIQFTERYSSKENTVVSDRRVETILRRYYEMEGNTNVFTLIREDGDGQLEIAPGDLVINREYMHTDHVQFNLVIDEREETVHGNIPLQDERVKTSDKIYQNSKNTSCENQKCGIYHWRTTE